MNTRNIIIGIFIIVAAILVWNFFSERAPTTTVDFNEEGNVVMDNPGLKPGVWYLVYDEPGNPARTVELATSQINNLSLTQGQRVRVEGELKDSLVIVDEITPIPDNVEDGIPITLYFYNPNNDQGVGGVQSTRNGLVAVSRVIPQTATPLADSIRLLLRGEISAEEREQGVTSEFPLSGVELTNATIQNGVATLTFADPQNRTGGGSCRIAILWAQIEATAKQFPSVTTVRFLPEELFQP